MAPPSYKIRSTPPPPPGHDIISPTPQVYLFYIRRKSLIHLDALDVYTTTDSTPGTDYTGTTILKHYGYLTLCSSYTMIILHYAYLTLCLSYIMVILHYSYLTLWLSYIIVILHYDYLTLCLSVEINLSETLLLMCV